MRTTAHHKPIAALIALAVAATTVVLAATAEPARAADPPITGTACAPGAGVTVVVDFVDLGDVQIGCAPGDQANGFEALAAAGFSFNEDPGAPDGAICQIGRLPAEGYPYCWYEGYWSYWQSDGAAPWGFATTGPNGGPLAAGSVEGWSWDGPAPGGGAPSVAVADLDDHRPPPPDCSLTAQVPTFDIIDDDEVLPVHLGDGYPTEVAVLADPSADPSTATFTVASEIDLAEQDGPTRILARRAGLECGENPVFDATYDVRDAYSPRVGTDGAGGPSPAIAADSEELVAFATGHRDYVPGGNVDPEYRNPEHAHGPIDGSLVVLGDRGSITLTFDQPIVDGPGADFAVFENGFAYGDADYLELAYAEVSSNGTDFVRFDTASRRVEPVGAYGTILASELGGLAGKDLGGHGTPFDLGLLANRPAVRAGSVDLQRITHVRIQDIQGDGADLDSFGRPIYDPNPVASTAGFDLAGVGVRNQFVAPPRTADESWAHAVLTDFLGRASTDDEVAAVVSRLEAGASRRTVAAELTASDPWLTAIVTQLFADTLDREPDPGGLAYWTGQIRSGRRTVAEVAAHFYASSEYHRNAGGTDGAWVADLYTKILGRAADPAGLAYWTAKTSARGRVHVAASIYASPESLRTRVTQLYEVLLDRQPDASGLAYWPGRVAAEGDLALAVHLATSGEYGRRAQVRFP